VKWTLLSERVGGAELAVALPDDGGVLDVSQSNVNSAAESGQIPRFRHKLTEIQGDWSNLTLGIASHQG